jgi:putative ABC transport system permease protein
MTPITLAFAYIRDRAWTTALNSLLLALGVGTIIALLLFANQLDKRLQRDLQGIDMVVGPQGSPLQLILSSVFHLDTPIGNVDKTSLLPIIRNPAVAKAVPIGLGDNFRGYRLVGTTHDFLGLYQATLAQGALWADKTPYQAVLGAEIAASLGIKVGDQFISSHGLDKNGHAHADEPYRVVGILKPTGAVIDRLVLTALESVWDAHAEHGSQAHEDHDDHEGHGHAHEHDEHKDHDHAQETHAPKEALLSVSRDVTQEVTALLVQFRSPVGAARLPIAIKQNTKLQAAVPAQEAARLFSLVGIGLDVLQGFAWLLIATSALSIFVALTASLAQRQGDIAMLRTMGATRTRVFSQILLEGVLLASLGTLLGLILGHAALEIAASAIPGARAAGLTGLSFLAQELYVIAGGLTLGAFAALIPAIRAYRTDIAQTLAQAT